MNTQYLKTPLMHFVYRMIISFLGGGMILPFLLTERWVGLFSLILLLINIPIMYNSLFSMAQYDQKEFHKKKPYPAKGTVMALLMLVPVGIFMLISGIVNRSSLGWMGGMNMGYRIVYTPYMALIGLKDAGFHLLYVLPVLIDIATMTLGYIAGMNDFSLTRILREKLIYSTKKNTKK